MPRPPRCRRVCSLPKAGEFAPSGCAADAEVIIMRIDEYEVIRLIDLLGLTQEQCAAQMDVSRTTVTGIYDGARRKLADALVHGKRLLIGKRTYNSVNMPAPAAIRVVRPENVIPKRRMIVMSENCNHDCSSCSSECSSRTQPQSFQAQPHEETHVKHVIAVVSGKGGVGKSLVTSLMAVQMQRRGFKTAILDADITGPSIPKAFGLTERATGDANGIFPVETKSGIKSCP